MDAALARGPVGITRRMVQLRRAELELGRGELATAADTLEQARRAGEGDHPFAGKLYELTAWLALSHGEFAAARLAVARGLAALEGLDDVQAASCLCRQGIEVEADRAEKARAGRHPSEAVAAAHEGQRLLEHVSTLSERPSARSLAEFPAIALTCAAEATRATGGPAADQWLTAATAWKTLNEPYHRAYCLAHAAETALTERRPRAEIANWVSLAHEIATDLGAVPLARALQSLAQRGRLAAAPRTAAPPAKSHAAPLGLTPREVEVLRLIGKGYTNANIADTLFISRKTASAHVSNILNKLDVGRRVEAAAIAARLGLLDEPKPQTTR
jgi:DNA-binding CsgD family transcriptional regulator